MIISSTSMTSAERLKAAMRREPTDHPPFAPFLAYFWEAQPAETRRAGRLRFLESIGADALWRGAPGIAASHVPGVAVREVRDGADTWVSYETPVGTLRERYTTSGAGKTRYLVHHAVQTAEEFKTLAWMEEHTRVFADDSGMRAHLEGDGREGLSLAMPIHLRRPELCKSSFQQLVEHWVGTEELVYVLADRPEDVQRVLEPMRERNREAVEISASVEEYEFFLTFEDSSTQNYSPTMYEEFIEPEISSWQRILTAGGKQFVQHACGHLRGILPAIHRQGIWGVESLTPPDTGNTNIAEARERYGPELGIIGGIDPIALDTLPEEELGGYVDEVLEANAAGRFILANADSCPPTVPASKLQSIADHVRRLR